MFPALGRNFDRHEPVPRFALVGPPFLLKCGHSGTAYCGTGGQNAVREDGLRPHNPDFAVTDLAPVDEGPRIALAQRRIVGAKPLDCRRRVSSDARALFY